MTSLAEEVPVPELYPGLAACSSFGSSSVEYVIFGFLEAFVVVLVVVVVVVLAVVVDLAAVDADVVGIVGFEVEELGITTEGMTLEVTFFALGTVGIIEFVFVSSVALLAVPAVVILILLTCGGSDVVDVRVVILLIC